MISCRAFADSDFCFLRYIQSVWCSELNQSALDRSSLEFKKHATSSHRRHCLFRQIHFQIVALESAVHVTNKLVVVIASLPPELLVVTGS